MAFAVHADVSTRLGRSLTTAEQNQATAVIAAVEKLILEAVNKDAAWATALSPVPETFKQLCIDKAIGAIANPQGVASQSEQLGSYQHTETFPRAADVGIALSADERRRIRRAIYGDVVSSPRVGSVLDDVYPIPIVRDE